MVPQELESVLALARPRFGFDLDCTLIDMRAATAHALHRMNSQLGENVDVEAVVGDLGAPFREQLLTWVEKDRIEATLRVFVESFVTEGLALLSVLPGAAEILAAVRRKGGQSVVITGRRTRVAGACLRRCRLSADAVAGGVVGAAKTPIMRRHGVDIYVGDHPLDMAAAGGAGVPGIGVASGGHSAGELADAGATAVVASLVEVAGWIEGHRGPAPDADDLAWRPAGG